MRIGVLAALCAALAACTGSSWTADTGRSDVPSVDVGGMDAPDALDATADVGIDVQPDRPPPADIVCEISCGDFRCLRCELGCCAEWRDAGFTDIGPPLDSGPPDTGPGLCSCGRGACTRSAPCGGTCTPGIPTSELCNGIDDDCDGAVDNGIDLTTDMNNCGACGAVCMNAPFATARCQSGVCTLRCFAGAGDCDDSRTNGCESDLAADPNHCNGCFHRCMSPTPRCVSGTCVP
jgi:hypothetical protein